MRYPVVFFQHGSDGSRVDFVPEALEVARLGAAALLIDAPQAESLRGSVIGNVVAWRRALDLLARREDVDPERVAFVGLSYGAAIGGLLAAAEPRIESFVLVSGPPRLRGHQMRDLAPARWVARSPHGELFFQAGRRDEVLAQVDLEDYFEAASEPKRIRWYDAGHVPGDRARQDRLRWISERLGLR
jgi:pimeloyl-ACP methyl ester carboxylesterase